MTVWRGGWTGYGGGWLKVVLEICGLWKTKASLRGSGGCGWAWGVGYPTNGSGGVMVL